MVPELALSRPVGWYESLDHLGGIGGEKIPFGIPGRVCSLVVALAPVGCGENVGVH